MIWMSNGMPPTSGHSGKVRGCCQALVPVDLSFLCTQQIHPWYPMDRPPQQWHMSFLFFWNSFMWPCDNTVIQGMATRNPLMKRASTSFQTLDYSKEKVSRKKRNLKTKCVTSYGLLANLFPFFFLSFFFFFDKQNLNSTLGQTDTKGPP